MKPTHSQSITHEGARSVCTMRASPVVNVLLPGGHGGNLTMCTFRTRSLTAAQSLWRKVWNVSRGQMQAALKGISITSRQAGPYVMVTGLGHFPCYASMCLHGNLLADTALHRTAGNVFWLLTGRAEQCLLCDNNEPKTRVWQAGLFCLS